jgi:hypothetical protein
MAAQRMQQTCAATAPVLKPVKPGNRSLQHADSAEKDEGARLTHSVPGRGHHPCPQGTSPRAARVRQAAPPPAHGRRAAGARSRRPLRGARGAHHTCSGERSAPRWCERHAATQQ